MPARNLNYYLLKLARLTGWLLLPIMLVYIATGFALCGILGFETLIDSQSAVEVHKFFDWPLVMLFLIHVSTTIYFAMRRWGWVGKRRSR